MKGWLIRREFYAIYGKFKKINTFKS
jgi:hypothetical protein